MMRSAGVESPKSMLVEPKPPRARILQTEAELRRIIVRGVYAAEAKSANESQAAAELSEMEKILRRNELLARVSAIEAKPAKGGSGGSGGGGGTPRTAARTGSLGAALGPVRESPSPSPVAGSAMKKM